MILPYTLTILTHMVKETGRDGLHEFIYFIHNKYGEVLDLDNTTLIVNFSCGKHWSVYLLGNQGYFYFYSMFYCWLTLQP